MKELLRSISVTFTGGALGGLANAFALWGAAILGLKLKLGFQLIPALADEWLYKRIVWGGIWGLLFVMPMLKQSPVKQGLLFSLVPSACQLLLVFPLHMPRGLLGMTLNHFTPYGIVAFNAIWGVVAALWCARSK
jgi:hypothetical protein